MEFSTLPDTLRIPPAMSACPISVLSAVTTPTSTTPCAVTEGEQGGLLHALSAVADPRTARGVRYPLAGLLTVAVCGHGRRVVVHRDRGLAARSGRHRPGPAGIPPQHPGHHDDVAAVDPPGRRPPGQRPRGLVAHPGPTLRHAPATTAPHRHRRGRQDDARR